MRVAGELTPCWSLAMGHTILLVDDNQAVTEIIRALLTRNDYEVEVANSPAQAEAKLARRKIDVVVSDVMMDDEDGFELGKRIRANDATAQVPIIFLTALDSIEDEFEAWMSGADAYMVKPFKARDLLLTIENVLAGRTRRRPGGSGRLGSQRGQLHALAAVYDSSLRRTIERAAKNADITVEFIDSIESALKKLDRDKFEILICDAAMPKFSSESISAYMRYFALNLPVVVLGEGGLSRECGADELADALRARFNPRP
jgi:DNA-binding response OmpR family regulator